MANISCFQLTASSIFVVLSAACAHPQTVTLTSAPATAPAAPSAVEADDTAAAAKDEAVVAAAKDGGKGEAVAAAKDGGTGALSFAELSASLGDENKMGLEMERTQEAYAGKGLSADGYSSVGAAHQAVDTGSSHLGGDIKVSGGLTTAAVRAGVHTESARLRSCYEHGLAQNPHLAGRVVVTFAVDAQGAVSDVDTESEAIPSDVAACIRNAFSAMTFAAPKSAPAKVSYPIDLNKDS
jgi:hypothetical protein